MSASSGYARSTPIELSRAEEAVELESGYKKGFVENITPLGSSAGDHESTDLDDPEWRPGFFNQFPIIGFGALCMVLLCAISSVVVLQVSNDQSSSIWPTQIAPNVLLSGLNSVANICYGICIANGVAIAWWRQVLKGATIKQLHRSWSFSMSLKDVLFKLKYFNFIALAALTTKLTIIDNMLMQKATYTYTDIDAPKFNHTAAIYANSTFPVTGYANMKKGGPGTLSQEVNWDIVSWQQNGGALPAYGAGPKALDCKDCGGYYFLNVSAAGFEYDCTAPVTTPINLGQATKNVTSWYDAHNGSSAADNTSSSSSDDPSATIPPLFSLNFTTIDSTGNTDDFTSDLHDVTGYSYIQMDITWTNATDVAGQECPGFITQQSCKLRPAVIKYPAMVTNTSNEGSIDRSSSRSLSPSMNLQLMPFEYWYYWYGYGKIEPEVEFGVYNLSTKQLNGFETVSYVDVYEPSLNNTGDPVARLLGLEQAFTEYFAGYASLSYDDDAGYYLYQSGNAQRYLYSSPEQNNSKIDMCGYTYTDPVNSNETAAYASIGSVGPVMQSINQIMFSLATDPYISDYTPYYPGVNETEQRVAPMTINKDVILVRQSVHYATNFGYMWGAFASMLICVVLVLPSYWGFWQLGRKVSLGPFEIAHAFRSPMTAAAHNGTVDDLIKQVGHQRVRFGQIITGDGQGLLAVAPPEVVARVHPSIKSARAEINEKMQQTFGKTMTH
ncbi:hypothetical protein BAUCODRAFT_29977 [Baudoinia panamericana UAMH 10762]|uniref:Uncharacterized protein n=1 Tax=Baudoinia panamericana (strain UAMH 10762) TaxID=717646 RepID=M2MRZ2_BAUPA|nr:uncharacterized protein BAUCODRAFT_29977 [Baudoinia panamericana UAMH 10762]EMC99606.1 hypothetical protein BAUCODRAFT_29977 [Baudoinia panamericana UAMH 10762]